MNQERLIPLAGVLLLLPFIAACASAEPQITEVIVTEEVRVIETVQVEITSTPEAQRPLERIRVGVLGVADSSTLPSLLAFENLPGLGYEVEPIFFGGFADEDAIIAVVNGDVDVASASANAVMRAIQEGADLRIVVARTKNDFVFVTPVEITDGSQLDGKIIGHFAEGTSGTAIARDWVASNWPEVEPQWLAVGGSHVRVQALSSGEIDATTLKIEDFFALNRDRPGEFHSLVSLGQVFPQLLWELWFVRPDWAQENPDALSALIQSQLLTVRRAYDESGFIVTRGRKYLTHLDEEYINGVLGLYLEAEIWNVNGGLSPEDVEWNIALFEELGDLEPGLTVELITDRSHLDAVLAEIGRQ